MALEPINDRPAIAGGSPLFPERLQLVRPSIPDKRQVFDALEGILDTGALTNAAHVAELERRAAEYLDVRHCIAVSSCTSGLMLVLKAAGLSGDVVLPSFTFAATAHAAAWNGLRTVFAEIDPATLTLSGAGVTKSMGVRTSAILATHTFGTPCDVDGLAEVAERNGVQLYFDAAHAFGSRHNGVAIGGFGNAEVFSLSPTKVLVAGEGGIISTNDDVLAERCRIGRDYGHRGDYDCIFPGLNARMSEIHAATALASLEDLDDRIGNRNRLAARYRESLTGIPGLGFPKVPAGDLSTFKDFTVLIDEGGFGVGAPDLATILDAEGIETRRYYSPPVHLMKAYRLKGGAGSLEVTERVASQVLTLPLSSDMSFDEIDGVAAAIRRAFHWGVKKLRRTADERRARRH